jgi:hypothetical protein
MPRFARASVTSRRKIRTLRCARGFVNSRQKGKAPPPRRRRHWHRQAVANRPTSKLGLRVRRHTPLTFQ